MGELILAFVTLTVLEIVLGIDNIVFISILVGKLPPEEQPKARLIGLGVAMVARVGLLLSISFVMGLTATLFGVAGQEISGRDLILILGGLFLLYKSVTEIHERFDDTKHKSEGTIGKRNSFVAVILQILVIDIVFSLDSVITAIGMSNDIGIMVAAVVIAVIFMMIFSNKISIFIAKHHSVKILALAFLVLIGVLLVAEGFDQHIPKGYVYFAMAFSVGVEMINIRLDKKSGFVAPEPKE
ncbi:MAG TPA: TerC family protein [Candidatus Kapabacteria bacterium]